MSEVTDADREKAAKLWARCRDGSAPVLVHEIAAALAEEREKARAPFLAEMKPTRWWRVLAADGSLWCETSDEEEARSSMRPGDKLWRLHELNVTEWRAAEGAAQ